jgi:riboflavin kinase / FMN adenylyltransferase
MAFHVLDGLGAVPEALKRAVVVIGNFDGCHRGHQTVFHIGIERARALGVPALMFTFEPHPQDVFAPAPFMFRLTDGAMKARLAEAIGFDGIVVMPFTRDFARVTAEDFVDRYLVGAVNVSAAIVGADFRFGRARAGDSEFLQAAGRRAGFEVTIADMLDEGDAPVSSSRVRMALAEGRVEDANELLGYHHILEGRVIHGDRRGRELGYPTANIALSQLSQLRQGIYAVRVRHAGSRHDGVASYGTRVMFNDAEPLLEVFVFDFDGDLYDSVLEVGLVSYLRGEKKFGSVPELIEAMDADSASARAHLSASAALSPLDERLGLFNA